jgi:organic radical activating enzyme
MYKNFRSVVLTGGEPMLRPGLVTKVADNIKAASQKTKVYLYTAKVDDLPQTMRVLRHIDGITLTLHEQKDVEPFKRLQDVLLEKIRRDKLQSDNVSGWRYANDLKRVAFRLNVFHGVDIRGVDTTGWQVKTMRWQDDCPVPKDEILMKYDMQKSDNATGAFPAIKETYGNYAFNNCICACIY